MPTGATLVRVVKLRRQLGLDAIAERHDMRAFGRIMAPVFTTAALDVMARMFIIGRQGFGWRGICVSHSLPLRMKVDFFFCRLSIYVYIWKQQKIDYRYRATDIIYRAMHHV